MTAEKILFLFVLVAATPLAYTRSQWTNDRVFPDDYEWGLHRRTKVSKESANEVDAPIDNVCQTEECQRIASSFIGSMDKSVDPCEDFYQFTCGRFAANNPILPSNVDSNPLQMYQDLVHERISGLLGKEPEPDDILPVKQAKKWYRSCMDTEKLEKRGLSPIISFATEAGGWPIAMKESDWDQEDYPWQKVESHYARLTGYHAFYDVIGGPPSNGSKIGEIAIKEPELFLARAQLMDTPAYQTFIKNAVQSFVKESSVAVSRATYQKEARELADFEIELKELILNERSDDPAKWTQSSMAFDEFVGWYERNTTQSVGAARIHWQSAIQGLFDTLNIKIDPSSRTFVENIGYIKGLGALFKKTKPRTIVNYVHWNYIAEMLSRTTESMSDELFNIGPSHLSFGAKERAPRWKECVKEMKMTYAAAYVFTKKYFPESTQIAAREMMKNIQIGLEANIDHSNYLDEKSKALEKEKLKAMKMFTGYPPWYHNATAVTDYYKGLTIDTQYLDNALTYMRFVRKAKLLPYTTQEEDATASMDPITVNAEYNEGVNVLNAPPAIFQSPLFTPGLPDNVNYGQIGLIIGHEMGHGFDDTGIRRGKDGDDAKLSINVLKNYYQRAHCFVDQFDKYFGVTARPQDTGVTLAFDDLGDTRGSKTKSENIADSTGLQAVFRAYKNLNDKTQRNASKLPGLESFTDDQIFFIAFGAFWCGSETPEYTKMTADDPHSPGNLRVNGGVSNTNAFAEVFGCPAGSAMNPSDKCSIWENPGSTPKNSPIKKTKKRTHSHWINQWKN